ncbi:MAG: phosphatase PAP2 family protein [Ginsengibacter sp.]
MLHKTFYALSLSLFILSSPCRVKAQDTTSIPPAIYTSNPVNINDHNYHYLKPTAFIIPGSFLVYGGLKPLIKGISTLDRRIMYNVQQRYPNFHTNAADYIIWIPSASVYAMDALQVKTEHNFKEHLIIDAGSILVTGAFGYGMRIISRNIKVYNEEGTKFPSGHTANVFRGAEILHQELKKDHPVVSYSGYVAAVGVGLLRIYDKDHLLTEVLAGAGLGILSTKLTYWLFSKVKERKK